MLILSPHELTIKTRACLNLVHPRNDKNVEIVNNLKTQRGIRCQVAYPGNTFIQPDTFDTFETVVIHSCTDKQLIDFNKRLASIRDRLVEALTSSTRNLVVIGEAIKLLPPNLLSIPENGAIATDAYTSTSIVDIPGLDLIKFYMVPTTSTLLNNQLYKRNILQFAKDHTPMYLMLSNGLYKSDGSSKGEFCAIEKNTIVKATKLPTIAMKDKKVKPIQAYYEEDFDEEGNLIK